MCCEKREDSKKEEEKTEKVGSMKNEERRVKIEQRGEKLTERLQVEKNDIYDGNYVPMYTSLYTYRYICLYVYTYVYICLSACLNIQYRNL